MTYALFLDDLLLDGLSLDALLLDAFVCYMAASSAPQFSQYHSVGRFIVPQSLHFSVFTGSSPDSAMTGSAS